MSSCRARHRFKEAHALKASGLTDEQIAEKMGLTLGSAKHYLLHDPETGLYVGKRNRAPHTGLTDWIARADALQRKHGVAKGNNKLMLEWVGGRHENG